MVPFKLLVLILFLNLCSVSFAQRRQSHGQQCTRSLRCDSRASLTCTKGLCECIRPDSMHYDSRYGRCSVLAGEKCIFTAVEGENKVERSWREEMPCVPNAQCTQGFCTCFDGFYENGNGTCSPKRGHREECESQNACREDQFLVCSNENRCECNQTISTFDFPRGSCVRLAGANCEDFHACVQYAFCRPPAADTGLQLEPQDGFVASSQYQGFKCVCQDGYFGNSEGLCERKRAFGETCKSDDYCLSDSYNLPLACTPEGTCGCDSKVSLFDIAGSICRTLAGASCERSEYCVENAECDRETSRFFMDDGVPKCKCLNDFFQTVNGTCERRRIYGVSCDSNEQCMPGLNCDQGLCHCDNTRSIYDLAKGKCVGLANSNCDGEGDCISNSRCEWPVGEHDAERRRCVCAAGFATSKNGSCLASNGVICGEHWTQGCNSEQGLVCMEGRCSCKYEQFQSFSYELAKCVSEVGGPCNADEDIPCVPNSKCLENENGVLKCECRGGYVEVNGNCQLTFGEPCNYTRGSTSCDQAAPLKCINGKCQCGPLEAYDLDLQKCRGKVGALCFLPEGPENTTDNVSCIPGAKCVKRRSMGESKGICKCTFGWRTTNGEICTQIRGVQSEEPRL